MPAVKVAAKTPIGFMPARFVVDPIKLRTTTPSITNRRIVAPVAKALLSILCMSCFFGSCWKLGVFSDLIPSFGTECSANRTAFL